LPGPSCGARRPLITPSPRPRPLGGSEEDAHDRPAPAPRPGRRGFNCARRRGSAGWARLRGPGPGHREAPAATGASTGKALAQKGAELGIKKATGSDVAVSTLRGAQKARKGDIAGGAQDVAASGIGAATALAVGSTGVGTPVAGLAGSAATSLAQTKAFRIAVVALAAI